MPPAIIAAGIGAAGSLAGGLIGAGASKSAANAQEAAANTAAQTQLQMFNTTQNNLAPYRNVGTSALNQLSALLGLNAPGASLPSGAFSANGKSGMVGAQAPQSPTSGTPWIDTSSGQPVLRVWDQSSGQWGQPTSAQSGQWLGGQNIQQILQGLPQGGAGGVNPTAQYAMQQLEQSPGYQFSLSQGTQAIDRSAAARGLDLSGGTLKDLNTFGQGLAQQTWNSYLGQIAGLGAQGENAAATTGYLGAGAASGAAQAQLAAGQAQAAGTVGSANQLQAGIQGALGSALYGYSQLQNPNQNAYNLGGSANFSVAPGTYSAPGDAFNLGGGPLNITLSDERAKEAMRKVGEIDVGASDPLSVYSFRYRGEGARTLHLGVSAQETQALRPDAVRVLDFGGSPLLGVDYAKLLKSEEEEEGEERVSSPLLPRLGAWRKAR